MKIELISKEQHAFLKKMKEKHFILTLQNEGYEYISESNLSDEDKKAIKAIEAILKDHIAGFSKFSNFRLSKNSKEIQIRFQYNWNADADPNESRGKSGSFIGVGYILVDELLNGFE